MIPPLGRALLAVAAVAALLAGMAAGLQRLGVDLATGLAGGTLASLHGPLMVSGFFGTVIGLERAVAVGKPWAYGAPLATGAGALGLIAGLPSEPMAGLLLAGTLVFLVVAVLVIRRQPALYTAALGLGALAWTAGTLAWLATGDIPSAAAAWACFLILTIAGERLELSRFLPPHRWKKPYAVMIFIMLLAGAGALCAGFEDGSWLFGTGLVAEAFWLLRFDVVRTTIRQTGLTRYMAVCLAGGYLWLLPAGLLVLICGVPQGGAIYDAILHAMFVGFVFAMVFGHMPVILPALIKRPFPFSARFYAPVLLLHASLALRIAGDLGDWDDLRWWGAVLNALTILFFLTLSAQAILAKPRPDKADYAKPTTGCGR